MPGVSAEFGSVPENYLLVDKFGIVAGSSHCEPMLCNNVHWRESEKGALELQSQSRHDPFRRK